MPETLPPPFDDLRTAAGYFSRGLGELLILHVLDESVILGNIVLEKGKVVLKDRGYMTGITPAQIAMPMQRGIVGTVCDLSGREWESLTFLGTQHCRLPSGASVAQLASSTAGKDQSAGGAVNFAGSVYRGFELLLRSQVLPVISLKSLETDQDCIGQAVCDLRIASIPQPIIHRIYDAVRNSIQKHLTVAVEDLELDDEEFKRLFGDYMNK
jgi:hypothetical protein